MRFTHSLRVRRSTPTLGGKRRNATKSGAFIASLFFAGVSYSATPPPPDPLDAVTWPEVAPLRPASVLALGEFEVKFEETTLSVVVRALGKGEIGHQGDAGDSIYWLCYTARNSRVWIISHGEMGGPEHAVTGVSVLWVPHAKVVAGCPALPSRYQSASIGRGLWVGISQAKAISALGRAEHAKGVWSAYGRAEKVRGNGNCAPEGYDLSNWFWYRAAQGRVVAIVAGQVTSC